MRAAALRQGLELGEFIFDRVEIRAVGRKEEEPRSNCLYGLAYRGAFVDGQVFEDYDIAGLQRRHEYLPGVGNEPLAGHRSVKNIGADMPLGRSAPMRVAVFQWPCGMVVRGRSRSGSA